MISKIKIANVASYSNDGITITPKRINYIFGTNGTGKTTISRVIAENEATKDSKVTWFKNRPLEIFVYNRDFIENSFASQMSGVFTLGAAQKTTETKLNVKQDERKRVQDNLDDLRKSQTQKKENKQNAFDRLA